MTGNKRGLILYLKDYFENHKRKPVTLKQISRYLKRLGISIARKALYQEIDALCDYGMIINGERGRNAAYIFVGWGVNE